MFYSFPPQSPPLKVVYKNNDVRLELSRLAKQGDPKMKVTCFQQQVQLEPDDALSSCIHYTDIFVYRNLLSGPLRLIV